jgi:hypothetical protein
MKLVPPCNRRGISAIYLAFSLLATAVIPLLVFASAPSWWSQRGVLIQNGTPDDYAPANQGQLKNIAKASVAEMDANLEGGAGNDLHNLIDRWAASVGTTNDFAPFNLGQLKNVAKPFYDRMISAGVLDNYPWVGASNSGDDFAVANIGQVKNLFSFEIPRANSLANPLGDRLAAGGLASLALEAHAVWIWGDSLNDGGNFYRNHPRRMSGLSGVTSVSAGGRHFAVLESGARCGPGEKTPADNSAMGQI